MIFLNIQFFSFTKQHGVLNQHSKSFVSNASVMSLLTRSIAIDPIAPHAQFDKVPGDLLDLAIFFRSRMTRHSRHNIWKAAEKDSEPHLANSEEARVRFDEYRVSDLVRQGFDFAPQP
jgi:hypothetical protein